MKSRILKLAGLAVAAIFCTIEANAQVGIGTPTPADAAQLEIFANNKGILIPRVGLASTTDIAAVEGTEVESLLVYNTATAGDVTPGFYYWVLEAGTAPDPIIPAHWERIVNQAQLDEVINNLNEDTDRIKALLRIAFPSNNLGDRTVNDGLLGDGKDSGGGLVYTPADGATPASIKYVYWNNDVDGDPGTDDGAYVTEDALSDLKDLLGDIFDSSTVNYTGDTWIDGKKIYSTVLDGVLKGGTSIFGTTAVLGVKADPTDKYFPGEGVSFTPAGVDVGTIIKLTLVDKTSQTLINQTVTDVKFETAKLYFRVGTGSQYSVLDAGDKEVSVIVEFSATPTP